MTHRTRARFAFVAWMIEAAITDLCKLLAVAVLGACFFIGDWHIVAVIAALIVVSLLNVDRARRL